MIHCHKIQVPCFSGDLGQLNAIETEKDIPFPVRRVYYITGVPEGIRRGFHSHRQLKQVLLCVHGSVKIEVKTPSASEIVELSTPSEGLYIGHMVWREMYDFSEGAVLLVLASEHYTEADYIRDYASYQQEAIKYFYEKEKKQ